MKRSHFMLLLLPASLVAASPAGAADETNATQSSSRTDYVSFRIISERNIFNPNRTGRSSSRNYTRREPDRRVRSERFALLGTMTYEKGRFAFFDGSSSEFRKVLKPEDNIAGFKIVDVVPTCVKLEMTNGQTLELCVGMQMRKREQEDWQLAGKADSAESSNGAPASVESSTGASNGETDSVLKRLMQQREQENGGTPAEAPTQPPAAQANPSPEKKDAPSSGETDDVLKRLLQKREQELNK
jgi:hypothetical protein